MVAPVYSNSTFVTGFDLKIGDWYTLRNRMIENLFEQNVLDNERSKPTVEISSYHFLHYHGQWLQDTMRNHPLLNKVQHMPFAWKESMMRAFLRACIVWWRKTKTARVTANGKLTGFTDKSRWRLEDSFTYPKFDGIYQMQHCEVDVTYCYGADEDVAVFTFKCVELLSERPTETTHEDIDSTLFKFDLLKAQLLKFPSLPGENDEERRENVNELSIRWQSKPGNWSYIYNDQRLRAAMRNGRTKNSYTIEIMVLDPQQVCSELWTQFGFPNMT
jgi:hypothetical protein